MEDLTKQQLVLLTLFVTFVVSIATSIVTVALLTDGTAAITQNISQVVERTIERVIEVPSATSTPATNEERQDLTQTAEKAAASLAEVRDKDGNAIGNGFAVSYGGKEWLVAGFEVAPAALEARFPSQAVLLGALRATTSDLAIFGLSGTSTPASALTASSAENGQTVIGIGSQGAVLGKLTEGVSLATGEFGTTAATAGTIGGAVLSDEGKILGLSIKPGRAISVQELMRIIDSIE